MATSLGALGAICFPLGVALLVLLVVVIALSRMASVGSLTVATLMPISLLILGLAGTLPLIYTLYGVLAWMVIVYSHLPNIRRLIAGTERRLGEPKKRNRPDPGAGPTGDSQFPARGLPLPLRHHGCRRCLAACSGRRALLLLR